jgi:hypothetical protein
MGRPAKRNRGEVDEADFTEGVAYGDVDALPRIADAASLGDIALAVGRAALRDRYRPFQRIDDFRGADGTGIAGEHVAAVGAPGGRDESITGQRFQ